MAIFRQVHCEFWTDPKVLEEMTPEDRYFYLYLLTNSHTTQIGIYTISRKVMGFELGYTTESINSLLDRFRKHHKLIKYNDDTREIAVINWGKYNLVRGGKPMEDCVKKELKEVKDLSLIPIVGEYVANEKLKELFFNFLEINDTSTIRESDAKEENENDEKNKDDFDTKVDDKDNSKIAKIETSINEHLHDTLTIRPREGGNKNKNKNNNNNNKHTQEETEENKQLEKIVCVLDKKINVSEAKRLLKASGGNADLIKAKYEIVKTMNYKNLMAIMITAIKEDWQKSKEQEDKPVSKSNTVNTKFHNFEQRTSKYTPEQLNKMIERKAR